MSKKRRLIILALFAILLFDIAYYNFSWETSYGCPRQVGPVTNGYTNGAPIGSNLQLLGQPCFYITYYAILGSITIVIVLLAPAERPHLWKTSAGKKTVTGLLT